MLKGKLLMWSKQRWNIKKRKWVFKKLMSLVFQMKKLRNLQAGGVKTWLI